MKSYYTTKRMKVKISLQRLLFILFLTGFMVSCKQDVDKAVPEQGEEKAWLEDYAPSDFIWGYIDTMGLFALTPRYDDARDFCEGLAAVNLKGKWGYTDKFGKLIVENKYMTCADFSGGVALVQNFNKKYQYIDTQGNVIFDCPGDECRSFVNGNAVFIVNEAYGIIDAKGKILVPARFQDLRFGAPGQLIAKQGNREGVIDTEGNWVIPAKPAIVKWADQGLYLIKENNEYQYWTMKGDKFGGIYTKASVFENSFAIVQKNGLFSIVDNRLKESYKTNKKLTSAGSGFWVEWQNDTSGVVINHVGKPYCEKPYKAFLKFAEGTLGMMEGENWGYIGRDCREMVAPSLPLAWDCIGGRIRFISQAGYGFLDKDGKVVIVPKFPEARDFKENLARAAIFR